MKNRLGVVVLVFLVSTALSGQSPIFSQYYLSYINNNPAFSGINRGGYGSAIYRNQWLGYDNAYNTMVLSYDRGVSRNSSLGGILIADRVGNGILSTVGAKAIGARKIAIDRHTMLKGGVELGVGYMHLNWDRLVFGDAINARFGHVTPGGSRLPTAENRPERFSNLYMDLGVGLLLYNKKYFGGVSLKHINRPIVSFFDSGERKPMQVNIQAGMQIELSDIKDRMILMPNIMASYAAGSAQVTLGTNYLFRTFYTGAWLRVARHNIDAVIASVGVKHQSWRISYSYDYTVSRLTPSSYGSHELGITIIFEDKSSRYSKFNDCFEIFR